MNIKIEKYNDQNTIWPVKGRHIMAQYDDYKIIVYQAYGTEIGKFASQNQFFGGAFKFSRMTWIKPNFLWMMYRNGWGQKTGQEITLAIHLKLEAFIRYLNEVVVSSYNADLFSDRDTWKKAIETSDARLQWDPDHNPYGNKLERKAIQIGLRNKLIQSYAREDILEIEDISEFVKEQFNNIKEKNLDALVTPFEAPLIFKDERLNQKLQIETNEQNNTNKQNT